MKGRLTLKHLGVWMHKWLQTPPVIQRIICPFPGGSCHFEKKDHRVFAGQLPENAGLCLVRICWKAPPLTYSSLLKGSLARGALSPIAASLAVSKDWSVSCQQSLLRWFPKRPWTILKSFWDDCDHFLLSTAGSQIINQNTWVLLSKYFQAQKGSLASFGLKFHILWRENSRKLQK